MPTRSARDRPSPERATIAVQHASRARGLPSAARLRVWARAAGAQNLDLTLRICGAAESRRLNARYRGRDHATNVLSFAYGAARGDIVLCHAVIAREARAQGKPLAAHYAHMVVHGVLHLRGYDHRRRADAARMERRERRVLRALGFADPWRVAPGPSDDRVRMPPPRLR